MSRQEIQDRQLELRTELKKLHEQRQEINLRIDNRESELVILCEAGLQEDN